MVNLGKTPREPDVYPRLRLGTGETGSPVEGQFGRGLGGEKQDLGHFSLEVLMTLQYVRTYEVTWRMRILGVFI